VKGGEPTLSHEERGAPQNRDHQRGSRQPNAEKQIFPSDALPPARKALLKKTQLRENTGEGKKIGGERARPLRDYNVAP